MIESGNFATENL